MIHITLPAFDEAGEVAMRETLEVEPLPGGDYRLLHSPAFVDGIAGGDVIALDPGAHGEYRLIARGGNLAVVVSLCARDDAASAAVASVRDLVTEWGGTFDGGPERMLVFTIPVAAGFARVEAAFNALTSTIEGATWWYGNVYENGNPTHPLMWWS